VPVLAHVSTVALLLVAGSCVTTPSVPNGQAASAMPSASRMPDRSLWLTQNLDLPTADS
jgi:hypothetical protein